jgi:hypothetical protein
MAVGFIGVENEPSVSGSIAISETNEEVIIGLQFLQQTGMALVLGSHGVFLASEKELATYIGELLRLYPSADTLPDNLLGLDENN